VQSRREKVLGSVSRLVSGLLARFNFPSVRVLEKEKKKTLGAFHSTKNSGTFETGANGTEISLESFWKSENC